MKIDPVQVFANSLASLPLRILLVWLAISFGSVLSLVTDFGFEAFEDVGFLILCMPVYLLFVACLGDWWVYFSIPLLFITAWRALQFIISENTGSELMLLLFFAYMITSDFSDSEGIILRTVIGLLLLGLTVFLVRRDRELYPE